MITRNKAPEMPYTLINFEILPEDTMKDFQDSLSRIEAEDNLGVHAWRKPDDDYVSLKLAMRTDLPKYKKFCEKQREIIEAYKFMPSKME